MKIVRTTCPQCGYHYDIEMTDNQYERYSNNEENIQNIFPTMRPEIREMLITGICPTCWDKMFSFGT